MKQLTGLLFFLSLVCAGCQAEQTHTPPPKPYFVKQIDWLRKGQWLKADLHTHTRFSDGSHTVAEVVERAASFGCQVVAITDHADRNLTAATPSYIEAIEAARRAHPEMVILAGLEWNVPPHGGDEHAKVLLAHSDKAGQLLGEFKAAFDDYGLDEHRPELAEQALRWLGEHGDAGGVFPVVLYNHPNRKRDKGASIVAELVRLRGINDVIVGFEGGPGHQRGKQLGGYNRQQELIDRWDPAVAEIGGAWDQLLATGIDLWGAEASSDFHNPNPKDLHDFWPGEFSETWLYVREPTIAGVLQALRAGAFFGVHGHIAREARILVDADGLPRAAEAGEIISVPTGSELRVAVKCQPSAVDWEGKPNALDTLELIAIDETGAKELLVHAVSEDSPTLETTITPNGAFLVLRARGRRVIEDGPDLMFYTNSVRVIVEDQRSAATRGAPAKP